MSVGCGGMSGSRTPATTSPCSARSWSASCSSTSSASIRRRPQMVTSVVGSDAGAVARVALLFPGQGTQRVGMGGWTLRTAAGREVVTEVSDAAGFDVAHLCRFGPEDRLRRTRFAQPAIFACNAAAHAVLVAEGVTGSVAAGHSVGELNALVAAGVIDRFDAARL